ncbi:MAG TPA: energy transducer TonB [Acidobacteriaceae bacterium]|nr:energy transducer TonB [Acidobacteriaceae bacterium]
MKFEKQLLSLAAAILCGTFASFATAQTAPASTELPAQSLVVDAASLKATTPLTEDDLRARFVGKLIFLRGSYMGDNLEFDMNGKVNGSPAVTSFTLSAFEVRKVKLSKHKLEFEADRYGLHFLGALPYEDDTKSFDKVKISKKPVHIAIEREVIVIPKVKKEKKKEPTPQEIAAAQTLKTRDAAGTTEAPKPTTSAATVETDKALAAVSPEHSAMVMNKALDSIFSTDIDPRMMAQLPDYWQEYFNSKSQHRQFMPADPNIKVVGEGMTAPKVLNSIDPSSNEYAQKYGIAGMELLRTVVDANGVPRQMAIARPIGFGLDEKAVEAIKNSHFRPATLNGKPVPVVVDLVVTFRIYSNRTRPGSVQKGAKDPVLAASVADTDANLGR